VNAAMAEAVGGWGSHSVVFTYSSMYNEYVTTALAEAMRGGSRAVDVECVNAAMAEAMVVWQE